VVGTQRRYVLPDWELDADVPRGGWITLAEDGTLTPQALDGALL
jgi:UDP-2,3-diacylglucosamine hydrolase